MLLNTTRNGPQFLNYMHTLRGGRLLLRERTWWFLLCTNSMHVLRLLGCHSFFLHFFFFLHLPPLLGLSTGRNNDGRPNSAGCFTTPVPSGAFLLASPASDAACFTTVRTAVRTCSTAHAGWTLTRALR